MTASNLVKSVCAGLLIAHAVMHQARAQDAAPSLIPVPAGITATLDSPAFLTLGDGVLERRGIGSLYLDDSRCKGAGRAVKDFFHLWLSIDRLDEERAARRLAQWIMGLQMLPETITAADVYTHAKDMEEAMGMTLEEAAGRLAAVTRPCAIYGHEYWLQKYFLMLSDHTGEEHIYTAARSRRMLADFKVLSGG